LLTICVSTKRYSLNTTATVTAIFIRVQILTLQIGFYEKAVKKEYR
jgi:hypothetical protein